MATDEATATAPAIPPWRYRTGLGLFIAGTVAVVTAPIIVPLLGLDAGFIAVVILAAEAASLSSVFFLGWAGLNQLKNKLFSFLRPRPGARPVGRFRHYVGIFLTFPLSLGLDILAFVLVLVAYAKATPSDPFPLVWGLDNDALAWTVAGLFIGGYVSMIAGIFVLGEHWWGRFYALFGWQGEAR